MKLDCKNILHIIFLVFASCGKTGTLISDDVSGEEESASDGIREIQHDTTTDGEIPDEGVQPDQPDHDAPDMDAVCGDGLLQEGEECDDGNLIGNDGCDNNCNYSCHEAADCDDANACTGDTCESIENGRLCSNTPGTGPCDDLEPCTESDFCRDGECVPGANICECMINQDCASYDDDDLCNGFYACDVDHTCEIDPDTVVECDPSMDSDCRRNVCDPASGLCDFIYSAAGAPCNDGDSCNNPDFCDEAGVCLGSPSDLTDCGGICVDILTDRNHCGGCSSPCRFDEDCTAGVCVNHPWNLLGTLPPPRESFWNGAYAQAIATDGSYPYVALVANDAGTSVLLIYRYNSGLWEESPSIRYIINLGRYRYPMVDIAFDAAGPYIIVPDVQSALPATNITLRHCSIDLLSCEDEYYFYDRGDWSYQVYVKMDFADHEAHFVLNDHGAAASHAWYESMDDAFYSHSPTGAISIRGYGRSDVLVADRPYVATMEHVSSGEGNIYVRYWDDVSSSWQVLDGDLREHNGQCVAPGYYTTPCAIRLAADSSGTLYAIWIENLDDATRLVYVKRHDGSTWTRLGGPLNDPADGGLGTGGDPVLRIVEGEIFAIYKEQVVSYHLLYVKRWNGTAWESISSPLNTTPDSNAIEPDATSIGSTLYVSFIENVTGNYRITVKSFP